MAAVSYPRSLSVAGSDSNGSEGLFTSVPKVIAEAGRERRRRLYVAVAPESASRSAGRPDNPMVRLLLFPRACRSGSAASHLQSSSVNHAIHARPSATAMTPASKVASVSEFREEAPVGPSSGPSQSFPNQRRRSGNSDTNLAASSEARAVGMRSLSGSASL
jgi:hypothetical protein